MVKETASGDLLPQTHPSALLLESAVPGAAPCLFGVQARHGCLPAQYLHEMHGTLYTAVCLCLLRQVYPHLPPEHRPLEVVQNPGETIFLPAGEHT